MIEFEIAQRVLVEPFGKSGTIRSKSTDPHGTTLYGVVYDHDEVTRVKRKSGAMDVYVQGKRLVALDSVVSIDDGEYVPVGESDVHLMEVLNDSRITIS